MFDHIGFLVRNSQVSLPFFTACLKPLGIERVQDRANYVAFVLDPDNSLNDAAVRVEARSEPAPAPRARDSFPRSRLSPCTLR
jgi:catechol 2,3-dioxygenase-like lactoylglutathione lyase family enzyme